LKSGNFDLLFVLLITWTWLRGVLFLFLCSVIAEWIKQYL